LIAALRGHFLSIATFLTPLLFRYRLPLKIASEFNSFFTRVGKQISNSLPEVAKAPEDYVNYNRQIPNMQLGNTTPTHVKKVIANFQPKPVVI
jgi:hypothetical protein